MTRKSSIFTFVLTATLLMVVFLCLVILSSCSPKQETEGRIRITDSTGYSVSFDETPKRVVALQATVADIWLLAGGDIVGISEDYLDYGLNLENVTVIGETHYTNKEYIVSLNPDLVIYSTKHDKTVIDDLKSFGIKTFGAEIENFSDYLYVLKQFTALTERPDLYKTNGEDVKASIDSLLSFVPSGKESSYLLLRTRSTTTPTIIAGDHFVDTMLKELGASNVATGDGSMGNLTFSMEEVVKKNPDYIFITFMGINNVLKSKQWLENNVLNQPAWKSLDAVKEGRVIYLYDENHLEDAHLFQYKPNEKWAEAYLRLYGILYEE
ncbi:MAG: ABC transporter substrate-binding protein [Clostridia bacterium]|nr:ABC transporter substrate-binding protein [Clostridia bacterium]